MADEYYYSGSEFYDEADSGAGATFTDVSDLPGPFAGYACKRARHFGQWWMLTGVAADCPHPAQAQERLRQQYARMVTLNHPGITRAVAMVQTPFFKDECIVEEYVDGVPLDEFMQSGPDEALRRKLLDQIVDALQYSHHKGICHGNLSPAAVMVTHQDHISKLVAYSDQGDKLADIKAMGDIIDTLKLNSFKSIAAACRNGKFKSIDEVEKALAGRTGKKWLPFVAFALTLTAVAAGAFWTGHRVSMQRDSRQADSMPLPGIYFSDTTTFTTLTDNGYLVSSVTGAYTYMDDNEPGDIPEDVAIDLGLSVLWAPFNVGCADCNLVKLGNDYTWCDTLGVGAFLPLDDIWPPGRAMIDISATRWDTARRIWKSGWRTPTHDEWEELRGKCKWSLIKQRGIPMGYKVHGPSGEEIFLPMAGYRLRFRGYDRGLVGHYWSSTPVMGVDRQAYALRIDSTSIDISDTVPLTHCLSIRPVLDKKKSPL